MKKVYHSTDYTVIQPFLILATKICTGCHEEKSLDDFCLKSQSKDGYAYRCKECQAAYAHSHRAERLVYRLKTKENKEYWQTQVDKRRERRHRNAEHLRELKHWRYTNEPEYAKRYQTQNKEWRKKHPWNEKERKARQDARRRNAAIGKVNYQHILERDGLICYICLKPIDPTLGANEPGKLTFDHVIPLTPRRGNPKGTHSEENLKPAHRICNSRKINIPFEQLTRHQRRGPAS